MSVSVAFIQRFAGGGELAGGGERVRFTLLLLDFVFHSFLIHPPRDAVVEGEKDEGQLLTSPCYTCQASSFDPSSAGGGYDEEKRRGPLSSLGLSFSVSIC